MSSEDDEKGWFDDDGAGDSSDESVDVLSSSQLLGSGNTESDGEDTSSEDDCVDRNTNRQRRAMLKSFGKLGKVVLNGHNAVRHFDAVSSAHVQVDQYLGTMDFLDLVLEFYPILIERFILLLPFDDDLNSQLGGGGYPFFFAVECIGKGMIAAGEFLQSPEAKITKSHRKHFEKLKKFHNRMLQLVEQQFGSMEDIYGCRFTLFANTRAETHDMVNVVTSDGASGNFKKQKPSSALSSQKLVLASESASPVGQIVAQQSKKVEVGLKGV